MARAPREGDHRRKESVMKHRTMPLIWALCASLMLSAPALADEKVSLEEVPAAVRETIQKHVGKGKLHEIEREKHKGAVVYEAEYLGEDGVNYEIKVAEDGKLLSKKKD
jgi:uncharacterized membrane protein YkoI